MNEAYRPLVDFVRENGEATQPRGFACFEVRPTSFSIEDAREGLYQGVSRYLNYRFFAVEALQYIAGWGKEKRHADLLVASNSKMKAFRNPVTHLFDGAYGPRLAQSLPAIADLLTRDPFSRQAYASIWHPSLLTELDNSLDIPCTLGLHFYQQGYRTLGMSAQMRSNDLNWGTPYDVAAFCSIQCLMAGILGWKPGQYHHYSGSLHIYLKTPPSVCRRPVETWSTDIEVPRFLAEAPPLNARALMHSANCLLERLAHHVLDLDQAWVDFNHPLGWEGPPSVQHYWRSWLTLIKHRWSTC
jgi:hypothetical protein